MATPIATPTWRIQFQRVSNVDNRIFTYTASVEVISEDEVKQIVAYLKKLGFDNIGYTLVIVIP